MSHNSTFSHFHFILQKSSFRCQLSISIKHLFYPMTKNYIKFWIIIRIVIVSWFRLNKIYRLAQHGFEGGRNVKTISFLKFRKIFIFSISSILSKSRECGVYVIMFTSENNFINVFYYKSRTIHIFLYGKFSDPL